MTNLKQTFKKAFNKKRDEVRSDRELRKIGKDRKTACAIWVKYADKLMSEEKAAKHGVSIRACIAVLNAINKCSMTGDFTNAKQKRIAEVARYSLRTTGNAIRALCSMGLAFTKHQYRGTGKERRRVASYTILSAFRHKFDAMKSIISEGLSAKSIEKKIIGFSVSAATASQIKALSKVTAKFGIIDKETGEFCQFEDGVKEIRREYSISTGGI